MLQKVQQLHKNSNPKQFLMHVSQTVEMDKLLKVESFSYYNASHTQIPILVRIMDESLKEHYDMANYLLQIWDIEGKLIKEFKLKCKLSRKQLYLVKPFVMNNFKDAVVFQVDSLESFRSKETIFVVEFSYVPEKDINKLQRVTTVKKVEDFSTRPGAKISHLGYANGIVYIGYPDLVIAAQIEQPSAVIQKGASPEPSKSPQKLILPPILGSIQEQQLSRKGTNITQIQIPPQYKIHGFIENTKSLNEGYIICLVELQDNQISAQKLDVLDKDCQFYYLIETELRDFPNDPVQEFKCFIDKDDEMYGVSLRESRQADIYYNFSICSSTVDKNQPENLEEWQKFNRMRSEAGLSFGLEKFLTFQEVTITPYEIVFKYFDEESTKKRNGDLAVFREIHLSFKYKSRVGFDIAETRPYREEAWQIYKTQHIANFYKQFQSMTLVGTHFIVCFHNLLTYIDIRDSKLEWQPVLKFDQKVRKIVRNQRSEESTILVFLKSMQILEYELPQEKSAWNLVGQYEVPGKIKSLVSDWYDMSTHFIMYQKTNSKQLELLAIRNRKVMKVAIEDYKLDITDKFIRFLSNNRDEDFIVFNKNTRSLKFFKKKVQPLGNAGLENSEDIIFEVKDIDVTLPSRIKSGKFMIGMQTSYPNIVVLFDRKNGYIVDLNNPLMAQVVPNFEPARILLIDEMYFYSIVNTSETLDSGLYFQSFETFIHSKKEKSANSSASSFRLKSAVGGKSNYLEYFRQEERIVYQADFQTAKIVPILHRNQISFLGMKKRSAYLGFRKFENDLVAFDRKGNIFSWNLTNGMINPETQRVEGIHNLEKFVIYKSVMNDITYLMDWYCDSLLLYNQMEVEKIPNKRNFFGERCLQGITGGPSFKELQEMTFRRFKVVEITSKEQVVEHYEFIHPIYAKSNEKDSFQRLYISSDKDRMLEKLSDFKVYLYKKEAIADRPKFIKWQLIRKLEDFSYDISEYSLNNYLFSPNLKYYLDFDVAAKNYIVVDAESDQVFREISIGHLNPLRDIPKNVARKFMWVSDHEFKVINDWGFEMRVDIEKDFEIKGQCKIPMLYLEERMAEESGNSKFHYYFDYALDEDENIHDLQTTYERLLRKYQGHYSSMMTDNLSPIELEKKLVTIDFSRNKCKEKPVIDLSFSYLNWKMCEVLVNDDQAIDFLKMMGPLATRVLCLNIFPDGNTILHYLFNKIHLIKELYAIIEASNTVNLKDNFDIPFLRNFKSQSPMHLCVADQNEQAADVFLNQLKFDGVDNHSRAISDVLAQIIKMELPSMSEYLDSRLQMTEVLSTFKSGTLTHRRGISYGLSTALLWPNKDKIRKDMLSQSRIQKDLEIKIIDIPFIHDYTTRESSKVFLALSRVKDIQIFNNQVIQALIDFQWPLAREYTQKLLFAPFLIYLALFVTYSNVLNGQVDFYNQVRNARIVFIALLYGFSAYFLTNEFRQVYKLRLNYFGSVWNYSDLLGPILIIILISFHAKNMANEEYEIPAIITTVHSVASLLLWIKFLYFLRIFKQTGYLINALSVVVWDMKVFMLILLIVYIAFGEAFLRLSEQREDASFIPNYAYAFVYSFRLSIGDTDTDAFDDNLQPVTIWIIFVLCALYTNIVMLNLLIAIISKSFDNVNDNETQASYQERAKIISENSYLIRSQRKKDFCQRNSYMIIGKYVESTSEADKQNDEKLEAAAFRVPTQEASPSTLNFNSIQPDQIQFGPLLPPTLASMPSNSARDKDIKLLTSQIDSIQRKLDKLISAQGQKNQ